MIPQGVLYTREHEWVKLEGETAVMGITDYAQEQLGEVTFIELPAAGRIVKAREELASVESSKAASDVYAPLDGEIIEVNGELETQPELINQDCYQNGWICKLKVDTSPDTAGLMEAPQYEDYLKGL